MRKKRKARAKGYTEFFKNDVFVWFRRKDGGWITMPMSDWKRLLAHLAEQPPIVEHYGNTHPSF